MKKHKISIVIITHKENLNDYEHISLRRAMDVFSSYNKYLVIPPKVNPQNYINIKEINVIKLPNKHFINEDSYNALLLDSKFYEKFIESEFILIYQLDCFVFQDILSDLIVSDCDYMGAPWLDSSNHCNSIIIKTLLLKKPITTLKILKSRFLKEKRNTVGNGGFSLRKVDKFIEITENKEIKKYLNYWVNQKNHHEDSFFSFIVPLLVKNFKIADLSTALKFSFETNPRKCFILNNKKLPFGCHAWEKYDIDFWKSIFLNYGIYV